MTEFQTTDYYKKRFDAELIRDLSLEGCLHINTSDIVLPNPVYLNTIFDNNDMDASTVTFKANNPSYSYCKINETNPNLVEYMVEKEIISQIANVGIYSFRSVNKFIEYAYKQDYTHISIHLHIQKYIH